ncbi:protein translocase subunit SecD [Velocimicrobium porci]|uniref:Multifunctional fusion protein n=1 Tax=Velocimicrobium porci TaxID=2606634 RepID=A0A6L5Y3N8_9FIRM|nr:protein translocase subunit SecD [Velocimicrobium porci]MSS64763.1 protein translocase subunit SecD [Velocimicrobium porci]
MKDKKKALLQFIIIIAAIAVCSGITFIGIGKDHRGSAKNIKLGLDLAGGVSITYEAVGDTPTAQEMSDTVYKMQKRAEVYSTEAAVYQEGDRRVNIDIPGVTDANSILEALGKAGSIQFVDEAGNVVIDGSNIEDAKAVTQQDKTTGTNENVVKLTLNSKGSKKFAEATQANIGKQIAIVYDGKTVSSPVVQTAITDGVAIISGQKDHQEAEELASTIRIGALPVELKEVRSNVVGAKLGLEAINTSLLAGIIGFALIIIFMCVLYRMPGVAASIALILYIVAELVILNGLDVTLTLPGVAGIILSIGMAVDANVIIFTRIKEELTAGKTVRSAIKQGFDKALSAIVDGNVTTLIAAAVLWFKGSGTIKGFAQTLAIGIILSMFTALVVTKFLLYAFYSFGMDDVKYFGIQKERKVWDYVGNMKKTYGLAILIIVIGLGALVVNGSKGQALNYGLDFKGGTSTQVTFEEKITDELKAKVEKDFMKIAGSNVEIAQIQDENALVVKTDELTLKQREEVESILTKDFGVDAKKIQTESISATVSDDMKSDAVVSVIITTICMLIYIWIRFKDVRFGAGAVCALLHDVLIVLTVYAVSRISVGNTFIACMLTIVGYSINATIVVYDRIRENKKSMRSKDSLADVVNASISQTFSRSINTTITTLIMVVMLAILGVDSVREFAIPLIAGVVAGAYSSICISGTLWYLFTKISGKKTAK